MLSREDGSGYWRRRDGRERVRWIRRLLRLLGLGLNWRSRSTRDGGRVERVSGKGSRGVRIQVGVVRGMRIPWNRGRVSRNRV